MTIFPATATPTPATIIDDEKPLEIQLSEPIVLAERVRELANESISFKLDCHEVAKHVDRLAHMLRSLVRFATAKTSSIYDRPLRRISAEVFRNLHRAHTLVRKCRRRSTFIHRLVNLVTTADFRKVFSLLDTSAADLRWLLSVFHVDINTGNDVDDVVLSLPPIASNDPILAWVWSYTATVQMSSSLPARIEAGREIGSLAQDSDRNKKIIVEEGGIPPLLRLLKDVNSAEAQIAAAVALFNVANDGERVRVIVDNLGIPLIVKVLGDSPMRVQVKVAELVARMAEFDGGGGGGVAKEEFGRENVIRPLVSLLSFETFEDESKAVKKPQSIHSVVQINREIGINKLNSNYSSFSSFYPEIGVSKGGQTRKGRENESDEVKRELKVSCAKALWMLAKDSVSNSKRISETKGLLSLAKLIEKENGELLKNCVMAIMEITIAAETNTDLRRSAFKTSSPAGKAVVEQLLKVIKQSNDPILQIPAIRSIGCLSRTFSAKETRVIGPLVEQLSNKDHEVGTEAVVALVKFVDPENFLCHEHSKAVIEFDGVIPLLRLLRESDRAQVQGLLLLCYLAINAGNSEALEQARLLTALEGTDRTVTAQYPQLRELIVKAMYHLGLYHGDNHPLRQSSMRM
ncbi:hypothetical protein SOVF_069150 [Spinacia oleracea]|uniref:DUF7792 domain-containing protein n=1 Tax=Spinacia oleracea TaxID=3562 RepID=A0A9R0IQV8_SPIOL|nr:uncharacterized protein LOC110793115 [Spinacia oleracea]KNA18609.1 hypothetical protein SOVF_069150 [Spinacia oleracea]